MVSSPEHTDTSVVFQETLTSGLPDHEPWESARVIPSGMLPAVLWSQNPPRFLRIAGDQLVWLAWTVCSHIEVWAVRIDELGEAEDNVVDALPALFDGPDLTDACDYHLATCTATDTYTAGRIVALLQEHPQAPPSRVFRRLVVEVTPMNPDLLRWFAAALPYLCERGIEVETVRAKLRLLAGLERPLLGTPDWSPSVEAMLSALVHEPEAGRVILASALRHESSYTVENAAVLLIAIAAPWCAVLLEAAQPCSPHPGIIDAALSWLGLRTAPSTTESQLEWRVGMSRKSIERLHELQRAALRVEGVDN